jgi:cation:H+ antiporter
MAIAAPLPGVAARLGLIHLPLVVETTLLGAAILGAAFLLSWAAEVAQHDISQTLAIAVLAFIAVLPEYAVDLFLAYRAGQGDDQRRHFAVANMTGANRLLIGVGWAAVVLIFWLKTRKRKVNLRPEQRTDVGFLLVATLWAFSIPIRGQLSLLDLAVLGVLFVAYIVRAAKEEVEEPELIGAAAALGAMPQRPPRITTVLSVPVRGGEHPPREEPLSENTSGLSLGDPSEQLRVLDLHGGPVLDDDHVEKRLVPERRPVEQVLRVRDPVLVERGRPAPPGRPSS